MEGFTVESYQIIYQMYSVKLNGKKSSFAHSNKKSVSPNSDKAKVSSPIYL